MKKVLLVLMLAVCIFVVGGICVYANAVTQAESTTTEFTDIEGDWAEEAINALKDDGLVIGYPDSTFRPNTPITRAEVAMIIYRLQQLNEETPTAETTATNGN